MLECASAEMAKRRSWGLRFGCLARADVASDGEAREVADRAARRRRRRPSPRACPATLGEVRERLVLGDDDAARLQPARAVQTRAGDDHVEEQRVLGRGVRNEGEKAGRVDRDDGGRERRLEELEDLFGVATFGT